MDEDIVKTVKNIESLLHKAEVDTIEDFFTKHKLLLKFKDKHGNKSIIIS